MHRFFPAALAVLTVTAVMSVPRAAQAKPPFAEKEGKPCTYCHAPDGPPKRNYRGVYYAAHNNTFEEFDDAAEAKKAGVAIGPDAEPKPKSWTAPKAAEPAPDPGVAAKGPSMAELKKRVAAAEAACKKKPKDPACRKAYGAALADLGHAQMLDQAVPPARRYPGALKTLRQALKLDPANKSAREDVAMIEEAYRSMGRPIPK